VTDLALLVGVGDGPLLEGLHGVERFSEGRGHALEELGRDVHAAEVETEAQLRIVVEPGAVAFPQLPLRHQLTSRDDGC